MTKAVFNRSTRVARPKRTEPALFREDPARRETLARRHHEIAHGNPYFEPTPEARHCSARPRSLHLEPPVPLFICFLAQFCPTILPLFYDHALRWAPENLPGFLGKEPRQLSDFEGLLFDRTIPFDQKAP